MNERTHNSGLDDDTSDESLRQLLREVGARDLPSIDMTNDVRRAVHDEWRAVVEQRRRRNRFAGFGIAAGIAAVGIAVAVSLRLASGPAAPVAEIARIDGAMQIAVDGGDQWRSVVVGEVLTAGTLLRTDEGSRAALDFGDGVSVRLDAASRVALNSPDHIVLDSGAVYIDAVPQLQAQADVTPGTLVVETLYGSVRHVGTQYEVRTMRDGIEVSVREGHVEIANTHQKFDGNAGEQLLIGRAGEPERRTVLPQDQRWQWATSIAPVFDIERQPLTLFLDWVARETGKPISYATPEARARAGQLILRGSVSNLPPEQALAAVLATTPFTHLDTSSGIRIRL